MSYRSTLCVPTSTWWLIRVNLPIMRSRASKTWRRNWQIWSLIRRCKSSRLRSWTACFGCSLSRTKTWRTTSPTTRRSTGRRPMMIGGIQAATMSYSRTRLTLWVKGAMRGDCCGDSRRVAFVHRVGWAQPRLRSLPWVALMWLGAVVVASSFRNRMITNCSGRVLLRQRVRAASWMARWTKTRLEVEFQWLRISRTQSEGSYRRTREGPITLLPNRREPSRWDNRLGYRRRAQRLIWSIMWIALLSIWIRALSTTHMTRIASLWKVVS